MKEETKVLREVGLRLLKADAERYRKEAKWKRESAARLIKEAEELEFAAEQNEAILAHGA